MQLEQIRQDYPRLVRLIPRLLARLHEGLVLIRYPREPITIFLDELSALHDHVVDEHRRAQAEARAAALAQQDRVESIPGDLSGAIGAPADGSAGHWQPADQSVGAWVELLLGGEWVRAQLTWIGHNRNLFMFVSGAGLAHAMSRRTMDRLMTQERIRVVTPSYDLLIESGMAPLMADVSDDGPVDPDTGSSAG